MRWKTGIFGLLVILSLNLCPFWSAYASTTPVEDDGAINYVNELSTASSIPAGDLVAVIAGANSIYTGINWVNPDGSIALKNQLSPNLVSYKKNVLFGSSWDELDSTTQTQWGSQDNYNAANFNSSLDAYGLGDARDRFYASGGSNFSFTSGEQNILDRLKSVYDDWNTGKDVLISNVLGLFTNDAEDDFGEYLGVHSKMLDTSKLDGYVNTMPEPLYVNQGTTFTFQTAWGGTITFNARIAANAPVYCVVWYYDDTRYRILLCSKSSFSYGMYANGDNYPPTSTAASHKTGDYDYYYGGDGLQGGPFRGGISLSGASTYSNFAELARVILFSDQINGMGSVQPDIEGYPEDIQASASVGAYYPTGGIDEDTSWTKYLEYIEQDTDDMVELLKRILTQVKLIDTTSEDLTDLENALDQFTFYTGGILKVHDEGLFDSITDIGSDIHDILLTLTAWPKGDSVDAPDLIGDFNFPQLKTKAGNLTETISELAPFGGILLLSEMVGVLSQTGNISKPEFRVPFKFYPAHDYEVVIDLSWLDDGKVYVNFFCILSLIICLVNVTIRVIELEAAG